MKIKLEKTVLIEEIVDINDLKIVNMGSKDVNSFKLIVTYKGNDIAEGHLNYRTNFAHITMYREEQELEDFLIDGIENKTLALI